jgi:hypothetical protein
MPSYWVVIRKKTLGTKSETALSCADFDASDSNTKQHWLLLTADELTAYDQYCHEKADGIDSMKNEELKVKSEEYDNNIYDLQGRRFNSQFSIPNSQFKKCPTRIGTRSGKSSTSPCWLRLITARRYGCEPLSTNTVPTWTTRLR